MTRLRRILLGSLAAAGLAAPGATSAAPTTVCMVNMSPCPSGNAYVGPIGFELARTGNVAMEDAVLDVNGVPVNCTTVTENGHGANGEGSDGMGSILGNPGAPVTGNLNSGWFFNCTEDITFTPCGVSTDAGAPLWPLNITNVPLAAGSDGTLTLSFNAVTINCSGLGLACTYGPGTVSASWYNPGNPAAPDRSGPDAPAAQVHFAGVPLRASTSGCSNGVWKGNYAMRAGGDTTLGTNLWVE